MHELFKKAVQSTYIYVYRQINFYLQTFIFVKYSPYVQLITAYSASLYKRIQQLSSTSSVNSFKGHMASECGGRTGLIVSPFFANYLPPSQIFKLYPAFFKRLWLNHLLMTKNVHNDVSNNSPVGHNRMRHPVVYLLAWKPYIPGALRAKRGERGILSKARNEHGKEFVFLMLSSGPMLFLWFWTPSTGFGIPCLRILIISGIPDFTSRNIPDFALRKEKFLVETPNEIVPNSGVLRLQSQE